jgi:Mrp family chromosome partitioning ATPase
VRTGPRPANPPAVLGSDRAAEVLDELRERFDIVLIDSAPVLAVTDTVPLLRYADATLFVGRFKVTSRDTVKRLHDFLARVPNVHVMGVVANELSRFDASSYGYGYGYYGPYSDDGSSAPPRRGGLRLGGRPPRDRQKV